MLSEIYFLSELRKWIRKNEKFLFENEVGEAKQISKNNDPYNT